MLLADTDAAAARAARAAELAGCRVLAHLDLAAAPAALAEGTSARILIAEFDEDRGDLLDRVLGQLGASARAGRPVVVSAPPELIDVVAAQAWGPSLEHLCHPTEDERVEAIGAAIAGAQPRLHDTSKGQLQQLSKEAARIADALASLSQKSEAAGAGDPSLPEEGEIDAARIRALIRARRMRDRYFPPDLFADPAWDMLLDLMAARLDGQRVAVSSLCIAAAVPATTALRWIKALTEQGLFVRVADPADGRRVYIELSDTTASALLDYLRAARRVTGLTI